MITGIRDYTNTAVITCLRVFSRACRIRRGLIKLQYKVTSITGTHCIKHLHEKYNAVKRLNFSTNIYYSLLQRWNRWHRMTKQVFLLFHLETEDRSIYFCHSLYTQTKRHQGDFYAWHWRDYLKQTENKNIQYFLWNAALHFQSQAQ